MNRPVHAVPVEGGEHRADRRCPCGPIAMRDLNTGQVSVWRHRTPPRTEAIDRMDRKARDEIAAWDRRVAG